MGRIVQKYGGSSVADAASIKRVARRIADVRAAGNEVVVVISAMGDTTDDLMDLALKVSDHPVPRELDMLITTGERQSAALLAMALSDLGVPACSFTGSQAGIITTSAHGDARIIDITPGRVVASMQEGKVVIVAGFQGVAQTTKDVTTLGRGASDTTAVALADALQADYCEIFTDVDGVFSADPRLVSSARRIPKISYEEMLEMAASGAKVLHLRCVEYARSAGMPIHVRSSFSESPGTWVTDGPMAGPEHIEDVVESPNMEQAIVSGVAQDSSVAKITITGVPDKLGSAARLFKAIAQAGVNVDMIVQNVPRADEPLADITFTLPMDDAQRASQALDAIREDVGFAGYEYDDHVAKVSIVGVGMRSNPGVAADLFGALADAGINIDMISTSDIRASVVVQAKDVQKAVQAAHRAFKLDSDSEAVVYAGTGR